MSSLNELMLTAILAARAARGPSINNESFICGHSLACQCSALCALIKNWERRNDQRIKHWVRIEQDICSVSIRLSHTHFFFIITLCINVAVRLLIPLGRRKKRMQQPNTTPVMLPYFSLAMLPLARSPPPPHSHSTPGIEHFTDHSHMDEDKFVYARLYARWGYGRVARSVSAPPKLHLFRCRSLFVIGCSLR